MAWRHWLNIVYKEMRAKADVSYLSRQVKKGLSLYEDEEREALLREANMNDFGWVGFCEGEERKRVDRNIAAKKQALNVAESLKPHIAQFGIIEPEDQSWYRMKVGLLEGRAGKFLGVPDTIDNQSKVTAEDVSSMGDPGGVCWDESWFYSRKSRGYSLDGVVRLKNKRVTYFRVYCKKGKRWQAKEEPPSNWIKSKREEIKNGSPGTIL